MARTATAPKARPGSAKKAANATPKKSPASVKKERQEAKQMQTVAKIVGQIYQEDIAKNTEYCHQMLGENPQWIEHLEMMFRQGVMQKHIDVFKAQQANAGTAAVQGNNDEAEEDLGAKVPDRVKKISKLPENFKLEVLRHLLQNFPEDPKQNVTKNAFVCALHIDDKTPMPTDPKAFRMKKLKDMCMVRYNFVGERYKGRDFEAEPPTKDDFVLWRVGAGDELEFVPAKLKVPLPVAAKGHYQWEFDDPMKIDAVLTSQAHKGMQFAVVNFLPEIMAIETTDIWPADTSGSVAASAAGSGAEATNDDKSPSKKKMKVALTPQK